MNNPGWLPPARLPKIPESVADIPDSRIATSELSVPNKPGSNVSSEIFDLDIIDSLDQARHVPGAWPSFENAAGSPPSTVPPGFIPHDTHIQDSPIYSAGFVSARGSPAFSFGYKSVQQSSVYSNSFYSTRPSPAYSAGYVGARESPFSSIGYNNTRQSPVHSSKPSSRRNELHMESASEYIKLLRKKKLIPRADEELNWSGRTPSRGQHVEFARGDKIPLEDMGLIGASQKAKISKVKCRRIMLARKSMVCGYDLKLEDALNEVEHLQRLRHAHIVRLVGSYTLGRHFSILIYPVAEYDLATFLEHVTTILQDDKLSYVQYNAVVSLGRFFACLASAISYIHASTTKHMDIKPQNILVKEHSRYLTYHQVYITDFGISRHFTLLDQSQTDSEIAKTPKYCAPEVDQEDNWGRSADIFSLGCVFLEMQTVLCRRSIDDFVEYRSKFTGRESFQANLSRVLEWVDLLMKDQAYLVPTIYGLKKQDRHASLLSIVKKMLPLEPESRIRASDLLKTFGGWDCCHGTPEEFRSDKPIDSKNQEIKNNLLLGKERVKLDYVLFIAAVSNGHYAFLKILLKEPAPLEYLSRLLHWTIVEEDETMFRLLVDSGADSFARHSGVHPLNGQMRSFGDKTPFTFAIERGQDNLVRFALETLKDDVDTGERNYLLDHALQIAVELGHHNVLKVVVEQGADINHHRDGKTALRIAAEHGDEATIRFLIGNGANPNNYDLGWTSPLHEIVRHKNEKLVKLFLEAGAELDARNTRGMTPFFDAVKYGYEPVLQLLLDSGSELDARDHRGKTPLHEAVNFRHKAVVQFLLSAGADLSTRDNRSKTPLHEATVDGNEEVAELLLSAGADPNVCDKAGMSPLHEAVVHRSEAVVKWLLKASADPNIRDSRGTTPIHEAVMSDQEAVVKMLLKAGADPNIRDGRGRTPLHEAVIFDHEAMVKMLLKAGADQEVADQDGKGAMYYAVHRERRAIVQLLLYAGADMLSLCRR